jgi:hypothetical protein
MQERGRAIREGAPENVVSYSTENYEEEFDADEIQVVGIHH